MPLKPIQEFGAAYSNASTSEYPSGSYKDETVPGSSRDGSPLVAVTENDRLGFDEALAAEVGMTFTNVPDTAVSSQRLEAHKKLIEQETLFNFPNVESMSDYLGHDVGDVVQTQGFTSSGDGGGATYQIVSGTSTVNGVDKIQVGVNTAVRIEAPFNYSCAFMFDDGHIAHKEILLPLFKSYGVRFGLAPDSRRTFNSADRLNQGDLVEMVRQGCEVANHGFSHIALGNDVESQKVSAEINTAWSSFNKLGVETPVFMTPSSVLGTDHTDLVKSMHKFAFTQTGSLTSNRNADPYKLRRVGMESYTTNQCKSAIRDAVRFGGSVVFYAHDTASGDEIYTRTEDLILYAQELGIDIKLPSASVQDAVSYVPDPPVKFTSGSIVTSGNNFTSFDADTSVDSNGILNVTSTGGVQSLVQKLFNVNLSDEGSITFSTGLVSASGTIGEENYIGFRITNLTTNEVYYENEEKIGILDTQNRRYSIPAGTYKGFVKILIYVRIDFQSVGAVAWVRDPILRYGTDVSALTYKNKVNQVSTVGLPSQTIPFSSYKEDGFLTITDQTDNGLYRIFSNILVFTKTTTVTISFNVNDFGVDAYSGDGGGLFVHLGNSAYLVDGFDVIKGQISAGNYSAGGDIQLTIRTLSEDTYLKFSVYSTTGDFNVDPLKSEVKIIDLGL